MSAATLVLLSCTDVPPLVAPDGSGVDRAYLTGAAANALNADGRFQLTSQSVWNRPELSEAEAAAIAEVWVRRFAPTNPSWYETHRGAPIKFGALHACGRAFYAQSAYEEPPADMLPAAVNNVSSHWFFTFCDQPDIPAVSVAVAASATHLRIANGTFDHQSRRGEEVSASGIPVGMTIPMLPERAAERLARESGRRIQSVPRLVLTGIPYFPTTARWEFELEVPVSARGTTGLVQPGRTFYVGLAVDKWKVNTYRAGPRAPNEEPEALIGLAEERYTFVRRADVPRRWDAVAFGGGPQ